MVYVLSQSCQKTKIAPPSVFQANPVEIVLDQDRYEEAYESFKRVRAESSDAFLNDEAALRADFAILREQIIFEKQQHLSFWDLFRLPHYRKRLIVGFVTMVAPQVTGTQIIYSTFRGSRPWED